MFSSVAERVGGPSFDRSFPEQVVQVAIPGDFSETDDDSDFWQGGDLAAEVGGAGADFARSGFVSGRRAPYDRGDVGVAEFEAVLAVGGGGLRGEAERVQDRIQEVAGAVSGERASGAIGAVGAESWNGACPVFLIDVGAASRLADALAVGTEAWAELAGYNRVLRLDESLRQDWGWTWRHKLDDRTR